jgi:hypothetical protein
VSEADTNRLIPPQPHTNKKYSSRPAGMKIKKHFSTRNEKKKAMSGTGFQAPTSNIRLYNICAED